MRIRASGKIVATLIGLVAGMFLIASCTSGSPEPVDPPRGENLLERHGLDGLDHRELVEQLETMPVENRPRDLMASVQNDAVKLTDTDGREASVPFPDDEFYLSIAPYVDQTHDCFFHSLTTCLGEMANEEVAVEILSEEGTVLVDDVIRTNDNGFLGLWLPRDIEGTLTVEHDGQSASTQIATAADSPTCLTTVHLT